MLVSITILLYFFTTLKTSHKFCSLLPLQPSCCLSGFVFELYKNNRCSSWNWYYANVLKKLPSRNFFTHPSSPFISCPSFLRIWSRLLQKSLIQKLHFFCSGARLQKSTKPVGSKREVCYLWRRRKNLKVALNTTKHIT